MARGIGAPKGWRTEAGYMIQRRAYLDTYSTRTVLIRVIRREDYTCRPNGLGRYPSVWDVIALGDEAWNSQMAATHRSLFKGLKTKADAVREADGEAFALYHGWTNPDEYDREAFPEYYRDRIVHREDR